MGRLTLLLSMLAIGLALAVTASAAQAKVSFQRIAGYNEPKTPKQYDRVGILKTFKSSKAKNVLIMVPGTSGSAAYFEPLAKQITNENPDWQVWSVERRENLLEDQSVFDQIKKGQASTQQVFEYYLGYLTDSSITNHYTNIPDSEVPFAREWGMNTAIEDMHGIVEQAKKLKGKIVLGGHSLGGTITTAYATWDFNGKAGADDLDGLVYIDGGSNPTPITPEAANTADEKLQTSTPWLAFGGIAAPFAGLFNSVAGTAVKSAPNDPATLTNWPLLPANLKPPVQTTNEAGYGYALSVPTSPPSLAAAQVHAGQLAAEGDPRGWDQAGAISPIQTVATAFSGWGLQGLDGTAWYHPMALTVDAGAVAAGNPNPAQGILDVPATHGRDLQKMPIYAFACALGGDRVIAAAQALAKQNGIKGKDLKLINRKSTYAHVDPMTAEPRNDFVSGLKPVLERVLG